MVHFASRKHDVRALALRLLERDPPHGPVADPETYLPEPLVSQLESLSRPDVPLDVGSLGTLCLKYFYAYVYPESCTLPVPLAEVTRLAGQFVRRRGGCRLLAGQPDLRRFLLHHGFALQMLVDLPKTVHLLLALLSRNPAAASGRFVGLDLGSGTGILLLGQYLLARRSGIAQPRLLGIEHLPAVAARADMLLRSLGVGSVRHGDATRAATYGDLPPGTVTCVTNETLPSAGRRLYKEPFPVICEALFQTLGERLEKTLFLPEAVWASDRTGGGWLRLAPENGFAGEGADKPLRLLFMRDVELAGTRIPVDRVGQGLEGLVQPPWRSVLFRRW